MLRDGPTLDRGNREYRREQYPLNAFTRMMIGNDSLETPSDKTGRGFGSFVVALDVSLKMFPGIFCYGGLLFIFRTYLLDVKLKKLRIEAERGGA